MWIPVPAGHGIVGHVTLVEEGFGSDGRAPMLIPVQHIIFGPPSADAVKTAL